MLHDFEAQEIVQGLADRDYRRYLPQPSDALELPSLSRFGATINACAGRRSSFRSGRHARARLRVTRHIEEGVGVAQM